MNYTYLQTQPPTSSVYLIANDFIIAEAIV